MFGRVRAAASNSLDSLELERPFPSKIIKDDSLSIYEITLQKLRLGSRRALIPSASTDTLNASATEAMRIDIPPASSADTLNASATEAMRIDIPPASSADTLNASSTESMKIDAPPPSTSTPSSSGIGESIHICEKQMVDTSCTSLSESKCKKGLRTHHDFGVVSGNLEFQPVGQKV
ncbi:hypothetical protein C5167_001775 [Papaver somniferum]|uniref:Uncharacterized protein n=1 Tax=Papaver somniferum TaxID=3469 RepID=A0A4Y7KZS4_PAPSO|nr:uncharacterized protein LOC113313489 [Papaver somniferum]RZC77591.1 hypothetical protein C5167_001775 [Papaver somniferum]